MQEETRKSEHESEETPRGTNRPQRSLLFIPIRFLGFTFSLTLLWTLLFDRQNLHSTSTDLVLFLITTGLTFLGIAVLGGPRDKNPSESSTFIYLLTACSATLLLFSGQMEQGPPTLSYLLYVVESLTVAGSTYYWLRFYSTLDVDQASVYIVSSFMASSVLFCLIETLKPQALPIAVTLLPICSYLAYRLSEKVLTIEQEKRARGDNSLRPVLPQAAAYFLYAVAAGYVLAMDLGTTPVLVGLLPGVGIGLGSVIVLLTIWSKSSRRHGFSVDQNVSLVLIVGSFVALVLMPAQYQVWLVPVLWAGFTILVWLLNPFSLDLIGTLGSKPKRVFGVIQGVLFVGAGIGGIIHASLATSHSAGELVSSTEALSLIALMILATILLHSLHGVWIASDLAAPQGPIQDQDLTGEEILLDISSVIGAMYNPESIATSIKTLQENGESHWRRKCISLAEEHHLSPRQTEVFMLLAKGRNTEYVADELVLSVHTVKSHVFSIYQKFNVHSQQELLSLVETDWRA